MRAIRNLFASLIAWGFILLLAGGVFAVVEHFHGDSDLWGVPDTGECGEHVYSLRSLDSFDLQPCDSPEAEYRVVRRFDGTLDPEVCAGEPAATDVYVYDGDTRDTGDEAVLCLSRLSQGEDGRPADFW